MSAKSSTGTEANLLLDIQQFLKHINFIKLRYYDSLLMNMPYKLFVNSANMTQEHIQIIATENSISINGMTYL